jgi:hypothetical protein
MSNVRAHTEEKLVKVAARKTWPGRVPPGMLLEGRVPSVLRRAPDFDVPGFLAVGSRDMLVPASAARKMLTQAETRACPPLDPQPPQLRFGAAGPSARVPAGVLIAAALVALIVCLGADLLG